MNLQERWPGLSMVLFRGNCQTSHFRTPGHDLARARQTASAHDAGNPEVEPHHEIGDATGWRLTAHLPRFVKTSLPLRLGRMSG